LQEAALSRPPDAASAQYTVVCSAGLDKLCSFYFEREDDFAEVRDFVKEQDKT
jgi:hypothetical protein